MFNYLVQLLQKQGYDVFIRDVSFLGFPSFHVIVAGFSEIDEFNDIKSLDEYAEYNNIKKYIRNIENISNQQIKEIMHFFSNSNYNSAASITQLLNIPVKDIFPWYYMKIDLFITAIYCNRGDYIKAHKAINRFIENMQKNPYNKMESTYYKCARDYIGTKINQLEEYPAITQLSTFYPLSIIQRIINDFGKPEQSLTRYDQIKCFNCNECTLKKHCLYEQVEQLYMKLKTRYTENPIDQNNLKELQHLKRA
ncbi:hypothetical protein IZY60_12675 [Lutibacter sp. B2]|nr:hypothetical protein [Lutibacter sp. B2]